MRLSMMMQEIRQPEIEDLSSADDLSIDMSELEPGAEEDLDIEDTDVEQSVSTVQPVVQEVIRRSIGTDVIW